MIANLKDTEQRRHKNGGGWIALTAKVDDSVFVAEHAIVYGKAELTGHVRVMDSAQVSGSAKLSGNVWVYGNAWLDHGTYSGKERIHSNAKVQAERKRLRPTEDGI